MTTATLQRARAAGLPVLQTYGLTEACSQVTTEMLSEADGTTAGSPIPGVEVRIVEPDSSGVGGIEVRGPTVAKGLGPWLQTKDLGSLDADPQVLDGDDRRVRVRLVPGHGRQRERFRLARRADLEILPRHRRLKIDCDCGFLVAIEDELQLAQVVIEGVGHDREARDGFLFRQGRMIAVGRAGSGVDKAFDFGVAAGLSIALVEQGAKEPKHKIFEFGKVGKFHDVTFFVDPYLRLSAGTFAIVPSTIAQDVLSAHAKN